MERDSKDSPSAGSPHPQSLGFRRISMVQYTTFFQALLVSSPRITPLPPPVSGTTTTTLFPSPDSAAEVSENPPPSSGTRQRRRGRPPGTRNKNRVEIEEGVNFKVHIITVHAGQDICSAIEAFSLQGRRKVLILSASGSVSYVTLRHQTSPGGSRVYIGPCDMLSLTCTVGESGICGFTLSIAGNRNEVYGGEVVGSLIAGTHIQVLLGTFVDEVNEPSSTLPDLNELCSEEDQKGEKPPSNLINLISSSEEEEEED